MSSRGVHLMVDIIKPITAFTSVVFMHSCEPSCEHCRLCGLFVLFTDNQNNQTDWTMWCSMEVLRLLGSWRMHSTV